LTRGILRVFESKKNSGGHTASRKKVSISIDSVVLKNIERISQERNCSRSRAIECALKEWVRIYLGEELKEGYRAMSVEDKETTEENLEVVRGMLN